MSTRSPGTTKGDYAGQPPELMSVADVAKMLQCSARHVIRLADSKEFPAGLKVGCLRRWSRRAVLEWIDRQQEGGR
jgi:excisionase family DNA binding protein